MSEFENKEKAAFFAMIRADADNDATRLVFADWCEEHGDLELAAMLRGGSEKWLREYAANLNPRVTYGKYQTADEPYDYEDYVPTSYVDLMAAAHAFLDSERHEEGTLFLSFDTPDFVYQNQDEFWRHFEVMTGRPGPSGEWKDFIRCAC